MPGYYSGTLIIFRNLLLVLCVSLCTGCGDVNWLPAYVRPPTAPDQFSFATKTGVGLGVTVTSDPVTVSGLAAATSPVTIHGPTGSNSQYSINGGPPSAAPGAVKNGDKLTVSHTSAASPGQSVTSTLTIGSVTGTFTSTTALVSLSSFVTTDPVWIWDQAYTTVKAVDFTGHIVSIRDNIDSGEALFSLAAPNTLPVSFTNITQSVPVLNNQLIWVRNLTDNVSAGVKTTLTVDGVDYAVSFTQ